MTPDQIKTIRTAVHRVGLNEPQYRTMLRNLGGVESCKDLTNDRFEDCMAFLEDLGFVGEDARYWRNKVGARGHFANARMVWMIRQLFAQYEAILRPTDTHYELSGLVSRAAHRRAAGITDPAQLTPREAWNLIEQLKDMIERMDAGEVPGPDGAHWPNHNEPAPF